MKKLFFIMAALVMAFSGCHKDPQNGGNGPTPTETTFTVTFDANGGYGEMEPQTFHVDEAQVLTVNTYTRANYMFVGWNTAGDSSGTNYTDGQEITISEDLTLYAQWRIVPQGAIGGLFSVSDSKRVFFSKGNLQYRASTNTWRFAENQWDYVGCQNPTYGGAGGTVSGSDNANISPYYSGWIDLFGWGTGNNPTNSSTSYSNYSSFTDWGSKPISNGGNQANQWRTLTKDEWIYLLNTRTTSSGLRYAKAIVNGVTGVIILPDEWNSLYYTLSSTNIDGAAFSANTITSSNWTSKLEAHGAVFLPAAGIRNGTSVDLVGSGGYYWSSSPIGSGNAYFLFFNDSYLDMGYFSRYYGQSVRLVSASE